MNPADFRSFTTKSSFPGSAGERTVFEALPRPGLAEPAMQWVPGWAPGNQNETLAEPVAHGNSLRSCVPLALPEEFWAKLRTVLGLAKKVIRTRYDSSTTLQRSRVIGSAFP